MISKSPCNIALGLQAAITSSTKMAGSHWMLLLKGSSRSCRRVPMASGGGDHGILRSFECSLLLLVNQSSPLPFKVSVVPTWVSFTWLNTRSPTNKKRSFCICKDVHTILSFPDPTNPMQRHCFQWSNLHWVWNHMACMMILFADLYLVFTDVDHLLLTYVPYLPT